MRIRISSNVSKDSVITTKTRTHQCSTRSEPEGSIASLLSSSLSIRKLVSKRPIWMEVSVMIELLRRREI